MIGPDGDRGDDGPKRGVVAIVLGVDIVKKSKGRTMLIVAGAIAVSMVLSIGCAGFFQDQLIFFPETIDDDEDLSWTGASEEVFVEAEDGARIHGLYFEPSQPARGVVLFFHGNAGSVATWYQVARRLTRFGVDVFLIDYRTYGKSTGEMSEQGLYFDGDATYEHLIERGHDPESIVVHGRSLGAVVATHVATEHDVGAVILETPFTDLPSLADDLYPVPIPGWLLTYRFDNLSRAPHIDAPTWVVHGTDDEIVPVEHGRQIYDALPQRRHITILDGGRHNNLMSFTDYQQQLEYFLDDAFEDAD